MLIQSIKLEVMFEKAMLQADSVFAYRKINNTSHLIGSTDKYFAALIGKDCVLLHSWKLKSEGRRKDSQMSLPEIDIGGSCNGLMK